MRNFENTNKDSFGILFESVSEGIVVVDRKQIIVAINPSGKTMFGYESGDVRGKHINTLIPPQEHGFTFSGDPRQMTMEHDLYGVRKDGTHFPVEVGLNPFTLGEEDYVMALVADIIERKEQERKILELNTQLEQKIEQRTLQLRQTVLELESEVSKRKKTEKKIKKSLRKERELNELKTNFLSLVSHEFKTPLSGIMISATLVGKYKTTEQQENREKHINIIENKVKYLNNILNDFLSIERLETGKTTYKFSIFPLSKVINEVIYDANMLLKEGQKISYPKGIEGINLHFDEKILELVLTNLINNAIKYSSKNTTIMVQAQVFKNSLEITVKDEGIGIPEKEQKYIFNRYFRAKNALLDQGTGIGLNIVKSHLENLGSSIRFTSKENEGSRFTVTFPLTSQKQKAK